MKAAEDGDAVPSNALTKDIIRMQIALELDWRP